MSDPCLELYHPAKRPHAFDVDTVARQAHTIAEALWDMAQASRDEKDLTCDPPMLSDLEPVFGLLTDITGRIAGIVDAGAGKGLQRWLDAIPLRVCDKEANRTHGR